MTKILFLPGEYPFCYYFRGYLPGVYSNQMVAKDFIMLGTDMSVERVRAQAKEADVVVFQRPNSAERVELMRLMKQWGKKVIFDNDDTYKLGKAIFLDQLKTEAQKKRAYDFAKYTDEAIVLADGVIASTEFLAQEYRELNPNVVVLKNCIDPLDEFPVKENTTGKFRVGFIGSVTTNDDYVHIKEQIRQLDARGDITIVVLGIKYKDGTKLDFMVEDYEFWKTIKNVEWHPYVHITEIMMTMADLALDLAIIPRKDNYFNRAKSNLKFLEMSLLHIPVIAQGFSDGLSPYEAEKDYMTVVYDNNEWYNKIIEIKEHYAEFKELAERAHKYVLENYDINKYAHNWVKEIENLCKFPKKS